MFPYVLGIIIPYRPDTSLHVVTLHNATGTIESCGTVKPAHDIQPAADNDNPSVVSRGWDSGHDRPCIPDYAVAVDCVDEDTRACCFVFVPAPTDVDFVAAANHRVVGPGSHHRRLHLPVVGVRVQSPQRVQNEILVQAAGHVEIVAPGGSGMLGPGSRQRRQRRPLVRYRIVFLARRAIVEDIKVSRFPRPTDSYQIVIHNPERKTTPFLLHRRHCRPRVRQRIVPEPERMNILLQTLIKAAPNNVQLVVEDGRSEIALFDVGYRSQIPPFADAGQVVGDFVGDPADAEPAHFQDGDLHPPRVYEPVLLPVGASAKEPGPEAAVGAEALEDWRLKELADVTRRDLAKVDVPQQLVYVLEPVMDELTYY